MENHVKYYYETDELPKPRPTQPEKKKKVKSGIWATFSHSKYFFRVLGLVLCRKQTARNLTQPKLSANALVAMVGVGVGCGGGGGNVGGDVGWMDRTSTYTDDPNEQSCNPEAAVTAR